MLIEGLPVVIFLVLLCSVVLVGVRCRGVALRQQGPITRSIWCPLHDRTMTATLQEEAWDGKRLDVLRCSAFPPSAAVVCGKPCLRLTRRPRSAPASSLPVF